MQKADELFREGRAAMKAGDVATACLKLQGSYDLDPAAGTAVNLGDCFAKQGKTGSALLAYRAARKLLEAGDPRITPVERQIALLEERTPRLVIRLDPDAPPGTDAQRDGRDVELGAVLRLNPGTHTIIVTAPERTSRRYSVVLRDGDERDLEVQPGPRSPSPEGRQPAQRVAAGTENNSSFRSWGYGVGAVGLGCLAFGAYNYFDFRIKETELDDSCTPGAPGPDCTDANRKASDAAGKRAAWGLGLGAGLVGASALLFYVASSRDQSADVRAGPMVAPKTAGLSVTGAW